MKYIYYTAVNLSSCVNFYENILKFFDPTLLGGLNKIHIYRIRKVGRFKKRRRGEFQKPGYRR